MRNRDPLLYVIDIMESIDKAVAYTAGMTYKEFLKNDMAQDAVVRNIEIIGEASAQLGAIFKKKHPSVPWDKMRSMRNKMIHEYFGVDFEIVWQAVSEDLPPVREAIKKIVDEGR